MAAAEWTATRLSADAIEISASLPRVGDELTVFLASDAHIDSAHCDRDRLKAHHDAATRRNAAILHIGDTFDAMQGKWDKRKNQKELRPEHRGNNYLDLLVDTTAQWFAPYAKNIVLLANGNHEMSIEERHETSLTDRLAQALRAHGGRPFTSGIQGWVRLILNTSTQRTSYWICYHHGYGGGGEVTRGMIDNSRTRSQYFADIFYSGHIHRRNYDENVMLVPNKAGRIETRTQHFLRGSSYKHDEHSTWGKSKGMAARPIGGWFVTLRYETQQNRRAMYEIRAERP